MLQSMDTSAWRLSSCASFHASAITARAGRFERSNLASADTPGMPPSRALVQRLASLLSIEPGSTLTGSVAIVPIPHLSAHPLPPELSPAAPAALDKLERPQRPPRSGKIVREIPCWFGLPGTEDRRYDPPAVLEALFTCKRGWIAEHSVEKKTLICLRHQSAECRLVAEFHLHRSYPEVQPRHLGLGLNVIPSSGSTLIASRFGSNVKAMSGRSWAKRIAGLECGGILSLPRDAALPSGTPRCSFILSSLCARRAALWYTPRQDVMRVTASAFTLGTPAYRPQ